MCSGFHNVLDGKVQMQWLSVIAQEVKASQHELHLNSDVPQVFVL